MLTMKNRVGQDRDGDREDTGDRRAPYMSDREMCRWLLGGALFLFGQTVSLIVAGVVLGLVLRWYIHKNVEDARQELQAMTARAKANNDAKERELEAEARRLAAQGR